MARLQPSALLHRVQVYIVRAPLPVVVVVVVVVQVLLRVLQVNLVQLVGVDVGVEAALDGEDDGDAQQQNGKQQELLPLRRGNTVSM